MNGFSKIVKYLAIALAILLIYGIIKFGYSLIKLGFNIFNDENIIIDTTETKLENDINIIDVDIKATNLEIKKGNELLVETNNKNIEIEQKNNKLYIKERKYNFLSKNINKGKVVIYIPNETIFDNVTIDTGAGQINVEYLKSQIIDLDLGAGKLVIDNIDILEKMKIDGGAGEIIIKNGTIKNLNLDMGVGNLELTANLIGNNEIDAGVGKIEANLTGSNYDINIDDCLGSKSINNEKISNLTTGNGANKLNIDGGVGNITVSTLNKSDEKFEMTIENTIKNNNETIILGRIISGNIKDEQEIVIYDEKDNLVLKTKIINKDPKIYDKTAENADPNDLVAITINNVEIELNNKYKIRVK